MKTTLYVNRKLLEEAMRLLGTSKMTEAVNKALEDFIRRSKLERLANRIGNTDLALNQSELEEMRKDEF
ncbi:MAG TPA: type II toxin-antitoxin system VapB family antitoxin [Thermoanaerobacterales bacterium]|nr:type II toxin-antitoxin system VapB family antitoxin [Tepidanaerobacteraceae bacterium]HHW01645.1 type II toxin-antitoxin system VapB family antitoxin [Thermoanaerobacterales bacterium]